MQKLLILTPSIFFSAVLLADEGLFIKEDWAKAQKLAKETGKPIMVDFYTEWCGWCKVMDKKTFSDSAVQVKLKSSYISLKLDAERGIGREVAMKYRVTGFPTFGFFSADGNLIGKISGYQEIEPYMAALDSMQQLNVAGKNRFPGVSKELKLNYPEIYSKSFGLNGERKFPTNEEVAQWFNENAEVKDEVYFNLLSRFFSKAPKETQNEFLENRESYSQKYGQQDIESILYSLINNRFYKAMKAKNEQDLITLVQDLSSYIAEDQVPRVSRQLKLSYYSSTKDFKTLTQLINTGIADGSLNNSAINNYAWDMYKGCDDKQCLADALAWMKKVTDNEPIYMYLDTYAAIAYKLDSYKLAKEYGIQAIEAGKEEGEDYKATEELLEKIQAELN